MTTQTPYKVVTANRLHDGVPIYFAGNGVWTPRIAEAAGSADADALLTDAQAGPMASQAIGAYAIEVSVEDGGVRPIELRERIRAFGPTA